MSMKANYIHYNSPQFHILSDKQLEELHFATLQILEKTGVTFECQEAFEVLGDAGADVSNPGRVKIPSHLVEQALRTAPKTITLYTREGEPAVVANGQTGSHFGTVPACFGYLDPATGETRECYPEDIGDMVRLTDALPNLEWLSPPMHRTTPAAIADKVGLLQCLLNSSKPVMFFANNTDSMEEGLSLCALIAGGEEKLKRKPFVTGMSEPSSPLVQGKDALEKSFLCAERRIPNVVYGMPMAGATTPATFAGCLAIANAEILSQLVAIQLRNPGAPVIYGSMPSIMDMKTTIYSYGAPEAVLMIGALTELCHYYGLPMFGTAGCTDAAGIDAQSGVEIAFQVMTSALTGADMVHDVGFVYHAAAVSPELMVLTDEVIGMVKVLMRGIEINDETLPLNLIERLGPKSNYLSENHTLKHFREFWMSRVFDRSFTRTEKTKSCGDMLRERTLEILRTYQPKPLAEDLVKELKKIEKSWFERLGLKYEYPKRKQG